MEQQQRQMTSIGVLDVCSIDQDQEPVPLASEELQQLSRRAQLWPLMEELALLNQLRLSTDLLQMGLCPG